MVPDVRLRAPSRTRGVDFARSAKVGLLGIFLNGFALGAWYRVLDRYIGSDRSVTRKFFVGVFSLSSLCTDAAGSTRLRV